MSELVNIKIDGKDYKVPAGMNLIEAADSVGVHIPNLCYLKGMKGIGACRMCLVEVGGRSMTACIMKTKEGMDVVANNDKIREMRKFVIDLILSMHPLDCMTCTKAGTCNLQNYAYDFEIKESTFSRKKFGFPTDEANPFIKRDPDYCVMCGRCVRACKEQGTSVLDFMGRGVGSKVTTANDKPLQDAGCTFCGSCVDVCPVNALLEADRWRKGREWEYNVTGSVCLLCGNACDIKVSSTKDGEIAKIRSGGEEGRADQYICAVGRYGFDCLAADTRLFTPMKRVNGKLEETTWDDALKLASEKMRGGDSAIVTSGGLTNEDAGVIKAYAGKVGVSSVATTISLYGDASSLIGESVDLEQADLLILVGLNPNQWERVLPSLDALLRTKAERNSNLVVIYDGDAKISEAAGVTIKGNEADSLKALAKALADKGMAVPAGLNLSGANVSEDVAKVADMFEKAANPVVISSPALFGAASNIALFKGAAVSIPIESNAKGVLLMGLTAYGKTYAGLTSSASGASSSAKTLYVVGEVPLDKRPQVDFLIVESSHLTSLAKEADLVMPAATYLEVDGTIVDYIGRLRQLYKAVEPPGDALPHREIFGKLAIAGGFEIAVPDYETISMAASGNDKLKASPFEKKSGFDVNPSEMIESIQSSVINGSRLLWLKEKDNTVAV